MVDAGVGVAVWEAGTYSSSSSDVSNQIGVLVPTPQSLTTTSYRFSGSTYGLPLSATNPPGAQIISTPPGENTFSSLFLFAIGAVTGVVIGVIVVGAATGVILGALVVAVAVVGAFAATVAAVGALVVVGSGAAAPPSFPHAEVGPLLGMAPVDGDGAITPGFAP